MKSNVVTLSIALFFAGCLSSSATSYYCDPVGGSMGNDGSISSPWGSLQAVFSAGKTFNAGDEIFLMNGAHGQAYISGTQTNYVTIRAFPGHDPRVAAVQLGAGSYWAFDGLTFTSDGTGGVFTKNYMLLTSRSTTFVKVENCTFYSARSSAGWSKADWYAHAKDAVRIRGDHTIFNNNVIKNTMFALQIEEDYAEVKNNLIDNFGGDAVRALGSHAVYENNIIRDAYIEDYAVNHDDAIQLYPLTNGVFDPNGFFDDLVFRNNTIYNFADPITQAMIDDNLVSYNMQSLIVTDGYIENSVVENNLIVTDHPHGITLSAPINCRVQNNTVIKTPTSINPDSSATPWIAFWADKNGGEPSNSIMRNNIASKFTPWTHAGGSNIVVENNLQPAVSQYENVFSDYSGFDFTLKTNSVAVDAGANTDLPATDLAGHPRLVGPAVDQGAYEVQSAPYISDISDTYLNDGIVFSFNESVSRSTAENTGNYTIDGGVSVIQASLGINNATVTLRTSMLTNDVLYTVTANGVEDLEGNPSSGTSAGFSYRCHTSWASTFQDDVFGFHPPEDAFDGDLTTRWSAEGTEWIQKNFCQTKTIESVDIAFPFGDQRNYAFSIDVSSDGRVYTQVFSGSSSGISTNLESFDFADLPGKYIRITGSGNTVNNWNNYSEIVIHASDYTSGYAAWILDYPGVGTATNMSDNPDNDSLDNLGEWGMGGNPDDANDIGYVPTIIVVEYLGDDWVEFVYARRADYIDLGLNYRVELNTNLMDETWMPINPADTVAGAPGSAGPGFASITNRVNTSDEDTQFLRLVLEAD